MAWSKWENLEGALIGAPSVVAKTFYQMEVFGRGADSALWHRRFDGKAWGQWESLVGTILEPPCVVSRRQSQWIDVFAIGGNHSLWVRQWNGQAWSD